MCAHNARGHSFGCQAVRTPYIYGDKHKSTCEVIQITPLNNMIEHDFKCCTPNYQDYILLGSLKINCSVFCCCFFVA